MRYLNASAFVLPGIVALFGVFALVTSVPEWYVPAILLGIGDLFVVAYQDIRRGSWSLDYIAFLAMALALLTHEWLAGAVIALMYTGGEALEEYASRRATASLSALLSRLPKNALVKEGDDVREAPLGELREGTHILVRRGELVPLDGFLVSNAATLDLANLTGESLPETVREGAFIKSGSVNAGEALELRVSGTLATSTYAKIIDLVRAGAENQAPFVRLADRANLPFTLLTLFVSGAAFAASGDITRVLAVLVIATPCPLIIAAPVAFVGGLSRAAGRNIIVKRPAALEALAKVTTIFFDKTGTLTLGEPTLARIDVLDGLSEARALSIAASLEFHSIHPTARAIVAAAKAHRFTPAPAEHMSEVVGVGISGLVAGRYASIEPAPPEKRAPGSISLMLSMDGTPLALFHLSDVLKDNAKELLASLTRERYTVAILTGDKRATAETVFAGIPVTIHADLEPEDKFRIIENARAGGARVAMVGDGLNDAPALAKADVGIVFSGTENSASIDAADIAILGHDPRAVEEIFALAKRSVHIASQSVYAGIALSIIGQAVAAFGYIPPVTGAILQEGIDVTVIVNALRAALAPRVKKEGYENPPNRFAIRGHCVARLS